MIYRNAGHGPRWLTLAYGPVIALILARRSLGPLNAAAALVIWGALIVAGEHAGFATSLSRQIATVPGVTPHMRYHFFTAGIFTIVSLVRQACKSLFTERVDRSMSNDSASLIAGILAGTAGLLTFLVIHHVWITPIWFILPLGLVIAAAGGLTVAWAYAELQHTLPQRPWSGFAFIALIAAMLSPALLLAELRQPLYAISAAGVANLAVGVPEAVFRFIAELLLTASVSGALIGWWLGRTRRAAVATGLAGFIFALGPGHNIPFIGGTPGLGKEIAIMTAVVIVSSITLVEAHAGLARSGRQNLRNVSD